ncbi:MAG: glycogen/starch synthase [Flavobacteriales bacterium]|nr:glycogen/starch synthase [Flavobacteriales bacterium]
MTKARVLYVTQAMEPYLPEGELTTKCRELPQAIQERGKEIRNFMPRYGSINERRHQLHEVIRLSGMNLVIDDHDHPLIIKVASIPQAKMQVYFIDNEEFFKRKSDLTDNDGKAHSDNDERMIFFCKGVAETIKKLGWAPDIIHCHGWFSSLLPMFIKNVYKDEPLFANSKVLYSMYNNHPKQKVNKKLHKKLEFENINPEYLEGLKDPEYDNLHKMGAMFSDAVIFGSDDISDDVKKYITEQDKPSMEFTGLEDFVEAYDKFYDMVLENDTVLAD